MYLRDIDFSLIDSNELVDELKAEVKTMDLVSEAELKYALSQMYLESSKVVTPLYFSISEEYSEAKAISFDRNATGNNLWEQIRSYTCKVLHRDSNSSEIIKAILDAIIMIIPGGIIIKILVKVVVKFFLDNGYAKLCPIV